MTKNKTTITTTFAITFLTLTLLMMPATSAHAFLLGPVCDDDGEGNSICKSVEVNDDTENGNNNGIIEKNEIIEFLFEIVVTTSSTTLIDVDVKDRLGGDIMSFGDPNVIFTDSLTCMLENPLNGGGHEKGGKTKKEFLDCTATETIEGITESALGPVTVSSITFTAKTDINPGQHKEKPNGKSGKNEYTSCGVHEVNSGATIEYWFLGQDTTLEPTILKTPAITVDVFEKNYPDGNCDGDLISDGLDECPFDYGEEPNGCPLED
jgi:hypothetical protein